MDERFVRSVRFWMRAYPRRWRAARGEELFGLVVDLAQPGTQRLGLSGVFDLLRGGLATRWRGHPPVLPWLGYRLFNGRIPVEYRAWALDDIEGYFYPLRRLPTHRAMLLWYFFLVGGPNWRTHRWIVNGLLLIVFVFAWSEQERREAAIKHVAARQRESLFEGTLVSQDGPRPRTTARWALPWVARLLGLASVASVVVVAFDGKSVTSVLWLAEALVVGLIGAWVTRRRMSRLVGVRVDQPHRILRAGSIEDKATLILLAAFVVDLVRSEVTGSGGFVLGVVIGAAALVLLPGTLVAIGFARRPSNADLTYSDVWSIAAKRRVPAADLPIPELRPLSGPVAEGAVVPPAPADPDDGTLIVSLP